MLGLNNARINELEAQNRILRDELDAANARAVALPARRALNAVLAPCVNQCRAQGVGAGVGGVQLDVQDAVFGFESIDAGVVQS